MDKRNAFLEAEIGGALFKHQIILKDEYKPEHQCVEQIAEHILKAGYGTKEEHLADLRKEGLGTVEDFEVCNECQGKGNYPNRNNETSTVSIDDCPACSGHGLIRRSHANEARE